MRDLIVVTLTVLMMASAAVAGQVGKVTLPDSLMAGQEQLLLNGAGFRKKLFIKVYAAGLYLKQKETDDKKIIAKDDPMAVRMHFVYDGVSSKKLVAAWNEGFEKGTGGDIQPISREIDKFNSFFTGEAKKNDIYDLIYIPGQGVGVYINGALIGTVPGLAFKQALFAIWLGDNPADAKLRRGMLGK